MQHIYKFVDSFKEKGLYPTFHRIEHAGTTPVVRIEKKDFLMFASNNYLSLSNDRRVLETSSKALFEEGLGPGGSRFLCGNIEILERLEKSLADFIGTEDVITFPTGYMANMAGVSVLVNSFFPGEPHNPHDAIIFSDENNHATLVDAIKISQARKIVYPHLDYAYLQKELKKNIKAHPKLIVTESVYSMDGNLADIRKIIALAKEYDSLIMIDDAHGIGVLGDSGSGVLKHFNVASDVDLVMGSFDKAFGGMGGYLGGKSKLIEYCRIAARPYIFSSPVSASMAAAIVKVIDILKTEKLRQETVFQKSNILREKLMNAGFKILGNHNLPVIPIHIGDERMCKKISEYLFNNGIFLPAIIWPAVPQNTARLRVAIMYNHEEEHFDTLVKHLKGARQTIR